jgi:hypothetical protein
MAYSLHCEIAEKNARLLISLMKQHIAKDLGAICGFFEVNHDWVCPSCHRNKSEISKIDKNGNLCCPIVSHHDHFRDLAEQKLPDYRREAWQAKMTHVDFYPYDSVGKGYERFPETLICGDCNVVEGAAKIAVGAKPDFSFSPFEISTFIIVEPNRSHLIDREKAQKAYERAAPYMAGYGDHLRKTIECSRSPETFENVGGAAFRVLRNLRKTMDEARARNGGEGDAP